MFKLVNKARKNEKGFTLVELMVVVVIIGILVAIAIPIYGQVTQNAQNRAHESNVRILTGAAQMYIAGQNTAPNTISAGPVTIGGSGATFLDAYLDDPASLVDPRNPSTRYQVTITNGNITVSP